MAPSRSGAAATPFVATPFPSSSSSSSSSLSGPASAPAAITGSPFFNSSSKRRALAVVLFLACPSLAVGGDELSLFAVCLAAAALAYAASKYYPRTTTGVSARAAGGALFLLAATFLPACLRALAIDPRSVGAVPEGLRALGGGSHAVGLALAFAAPLVVAAAPSALIFYALQPALPGPAKSKGLLD